MCTPPHRASCASSGGPSNFSPGFCEKDCGKIKIFAQASAMSTWPTIDWDFTTVMPSPPPGQFDEPSRGLTQYSCTRAADRRGQMQRLQVLPLTSSAIAWNRFALPSRSAWVSDPMEGWVSMRAGSLEGWVSTMVLGGCRKMSRSSCTTSPSQGLPAELARCENTT